MSIQGISAATNPYVASMQKSSSARSSQFNALASALQSGDITAAQDDFSQIQSLFSNTQNTQRAASSQVSGKQTQLGSDFDALGKALNSGDTKAAQVAFAKLTQDMQATGKTHHHHHGAKAPDQSTMPTTPAVSSADNTAASYLSGSKVNVLM